MTKLNNRYEFAKLVTKIVAYAFAMRTLPARVAVALMLCAFNGHWFIYALQCVLGADLIMYGLIMLLRTVGLAIYEVNTIATEYQRLMVTFGFRKEPLNAPPPPIHRSTDHSTASLFDFLAEPEAVGEGEQPQPLKITRGAPVPEMPYKLEWLKSGNWQVNDEELTKDEIKKRLSKYQSEQRAGKITPRGLQWLLYWQNVTHHIEQEEARNDKKRDDDFSKSIEHID